MQSNINRSQKVCLTLRGVIVPILFVLFSESAFSWGKIGHRIVGELAHERLSKRTKKKVRKILGFETMAEASLWPDRIKSVAEMRKKHSPKHYLSFNKGTELSSVKFQKNKNILSALSEFEKILADKKKTKEERKVALRFIIHLMGDLHQPLHLGYKKDAGGGKFKLRWFGKKTNLHVVWDEHLVEMEKLSYTEYVQRLLFQDKKTLKSYKAGNYLSWAQESRDLLPFVYNFKERKHWEYNYSYTHLETLNKRLTQAGVRLAMVLERVL